MQAEQVRILLVDDDQGDFEMIRVMLSRAEHGDFRLDWVGSFEEALDAFDQDQHDLYFIDYFLEDRNGLDLLREASSRGISAPLIMLTGRGTRSVELEAMKAGAADYLVKGRIDPAALERSIRRALERTQAERALAESEERHREMFEHLPIGLYRSTPDGTFVDANPALIRILGYPDREALREQNSQDLYVHPEDRKRFWTMLERYGLVRGFKTTIRRPDGLPIRVRNTARIHRDSEGRVLYLEGTLEDISGEREAEDLKEGEARFRAVFEGTRAGLALASLDGVLQEVNAPFAEAFSTTPQRMQGLSYLELLHEEDRAAAARELEGFSQGQRARVEAERRFTRPGSPPGWARTMTTLIRNAHGEPDHLLILMEDSR